MTTSFTTPASTERLKAARAAGLDPDLLIKAFRLMQTSRQLDDREILLKRQQRIFFQISAAGHEAIQIAAGLVTRPGYDWFYPYYRDRALCLTLGMTPSTCCCRLWARPTTPPPADARCPPTGPIRRRISSPVRRLRAHNLFRLWAVRKGCGILYPGEDRLVLASSGEGATSEGEFWESINQACLNRCSGPVSDRRQRLGDLRAGGTPDARRIHFKAAERLPRPSDYRGRGWHRSDLLLPGHERRRRMVPRRPRSRARTCSLHPPLLAFAQRR